jgi:transglutaminase-like putative cysteine protease
LPIFSPNLLILAAIVLAGGLLASGVVRLRDEDGTFLVVVRRRPRPLLSVRHRDTWLLLGLIVVLGWAVATALDRTWGVTGSDRLIPAMFLATVIGWLLVISGISGRWFAGASLAVTAGFLLLFSPPAFAGRLASASPDALWRWLSSVSVSASQLLLGGLIALMAVSALWTAWWSFRRRHGLAAVFPTGAIMAVEVLNDTNPILYFLTALWLAAAATILLRLNFVALKERWRLRRMPRASDTGWNFGEVGSEAIVLMLAVAFVLPPLSSEDVSNFLVPSATHGLEFHPFGIGTGAGGTFGRPQVGYSETIQPGASLQAKPVTIMYVTGVTSTYYPYLRGTALGGWNGTRWYPLPGTPELPVRTAGYPPNQAIARDDLPTDKRVVHTIQTTVQTLIPAADLYDAVFAAGEPTRVSSHPISVRGIVTVPLGDPITFDTVDKAALADNPRAAYGYTVEEVIVSADAQSLQQASTDYPASIDPYRTLYGPGRVAGSSAAEDQRIAALARSIVDAAGATTVYDQARAIEAWFHQSPFKYTLTPKKAPPGVRPLDFFLFQTHTGYCQDYATAMAVMLRTLGIPSRIGDGFGLVSYDDKAHRYQVSTTDAHTWVEVYFPGYGWTPFEPTPDNLNSPIARPLTPAALASGADTGGTSTAPKPRSNRLGQINAPIPVAAGPSLSNVWQPIALAAGVALLLLLIAGLLVLRWVMSPSDLPRIWRRLLFLSDRLRIPRQPGDTPNEFGARLATTIPELDPDVRTLATLYTRSRFRRGGLHGVERIEARRSWLRVRGQYARLLLRSIRGPRREGSFKPAEAGPSRNRGRGARR